MTKSTLAISDIINNVRITETEIWSLCFKL